MNVDLYIWHSHHLGFLSHSLSALKYFEINNNSIIMAHVDEEKQIREEQVSDIERNDNSLEKNQTADSNDARITCFTPEEQRKIIHRVDRRLVSVLGLLYMASLMDRTNLSAANIAGYAINHLRF